MALYAIGDTHLSLSAAKPMDVFGGGWEGYVDKLRAEKKLRNLRALLYFTDGDGFYPSEKTAYETAFVFLEKNAHLDKVPPWAVRLVVGEGVIRA